MRYTPDHKAKTRSRILEAAGKVFRRQGYHATGVDKVMEEAGLTPGGFYAHFDSKQALLVEALAHAGVEAGRRREAWTEGLSGREWIEAFLARYLDVGHCRRVEDGCPLVALVSEVSRADESVKDGFEALVRDLGGRLVAHARECRADGVEDRVLAALSMCVGGLSLARSVRNEAVAGRILASCREQAGEILCGGTPPPEKGKPRRGRKPS